MTIDELKRLTKGDFLVSSEGCRYEYLGRDEEGNYLLYGRPPYNEDIMLNYERYVPPYDEDKLENLEQTVYNQQSQIVELEKQIEGYQESQRLLKEKLAQYKTYLMNEEDNVKRLKKLLEYYNLIFDNIEMLRHSDKFKVDF